MLGGFLVNAVICLVDITYLYVFFCIVWCFILLIFMGLGTGCILFDYVFDYKPFSWYSLYLVEFSQDFVLDYGSAVLILLMVTLTFTIEIYGLSYLLEDFRIVEFILFFSCFILFMEQLMSSNDILYFYLTWESIGLCSFLLISFWCFRVYAVRSGMQALIFNKIGDLFLIFGFLCLVSIGITSYSLIAEYFFLGDVLWVILALEIAACFKTVHIITHVWLPQAMEGPTPVSSLLHSATLVTAGIIMQCRIVGSASTHWSSTIILVLAIFSVFVFGILSLYQVDLKRIVAYSTCSQIAYLSLSINLGFWSATMFHTVSHAIFKAMTFMLVGSGVHAMDNVQDLRYISSMSKKLQLTSILLLFSLFAMLGFPVLYGFWSKEMIIVLASHVFFGGIDVWLSLIVIACMVTSLYCLYLLIASMVNNASIKLPAATDDMVVSLISSFFYSFWIVILLGEMTSNMLYILDDPTPYDFTNMHLASYSLDVSGSMMILKLLFLSVLVCICVVVMTQVYQTYLWSLSYLGLNKLLFDYLSGLLVVATHALCFSSTLKVENIYLRVVMLAYQWVLRRVLFFTAYWSYTFAFLLVLLCSVLLLY